MHLFDYSHIDHKLLLSARAGLVAIKRLIRHLAQLPQVLDPLFPVKSGFSDSTVALGYFGLLSPGNIHFDCVEAMHKDAGFVQALGGALPSSPTLRQRIEQRVSDWLPGAASTLGRSGCIYGTQRVVEHGCR